MKKLIALAMVAALVALCAPAHAAKHWDDMSWWGNTGAKPDPVADSKGRSGYWWWPTEAASNADDGELWGNRGIVYHIYAKSEPAPAPKAEEPAKPGPEVAKRQAVNASFLFDFDKSILKPEGKATLDPIIADLKAHPGDTIAISGHTCDIGTDVYNMGLGQRRADAVKKYLTDNGIDAARITTVSFGETKPAVPNTDAANRKLNRRAEFNTTTVDPK